MNVILTYFQKYLFEPIKVCKDFELDNPRGEFEIEFWASYVEHSLTHSHLDSISPFYLPINSKDQNTLSWQSVTKLMSEKLKAGTPEEQQIFQKLRGKSVFEMIAQSLVFLRYNDSGYHKFYQKYGSKIPDMKIESEEYKEFGRLYMLNREMYEKIVNYSYLTTLLSYVNEIRPFDTFLLNPESEGLFYFKIDHKLNNNLWHWARILVGDNRWVPYEDYNTDFSLKNPETLISTYKCLAKFESDNVMKFIAASLRSISEADSKLSIITLVSLIEVLIIKKPDPNRYHIEDSIKKQFVLKLALIMNNYDQTLNLDNLRFNIRELYDQRSNIAHGNFKEYDKIALKNPKEEDWDVRIYTEHLQSFAYKALRILLREYMNNQDRIVFIKNN